MVPLAGHKAVVVGAAGAIGSACARAFAEAGATVTAVDKDLDGAAATAATLTGDHAALALDVCDPVAVTRIAEEISQARAYDSVVYAPGTVFTADVADIPWARYRALMSVNLDGAFHVAQGFVRPMLASQRPGSFVFLSSMAGLRGEAGASAYCASKFGLIGLVQSFAAEMTGREVRVNAVAPGNVDTPMLRQVARDIAANTGLSGDPDATYASFAQVGAARRLVTPAEVAAACVWLAGPASAGVTGTTLRVDAGALVG